MTRILSSSFGFVSISSLGLVLALGACGSDKPTPTPGGAAGSPPAAGGGSGPGPGTGGTPGTPTAGTPGTPGAGTGPGAAGSGSPAGGEGNVGTAGSGAGGAPPVGTAGSTSVAGSGGGTVVVPPVTLPPLVTSAMGAYWKTDVMPTDSTAAATVTVNDTAAAQKWDGMGAAFNELGWKFLSTADMQNKAIGLLFSDKDGANFAWGRIPMGASDYAESRYSLEDIDGADPAPDGTESNRPAADTALAKFSLERDKKKLIPYIKAAQAVKKDLRFWASPWTPPVWMKTGYKKNSGADSSKNAVKPSYYDGGTMKSDAATLTAYAEYYKKFVTGYKDQGINIEIVSPQNEPGYDQNYPSCLWEKATYASFIGTYLGPAMQPLGVKVMLGTLSNDKTDFDVAAGAAADAKAKPFLAVVGAQWNTLDAAKLGALNSGLPFWATEHKCGNYPWNPAGYPAYNSAQAPNDHAYGVESWGYIRDAIKTVKVTSYNAWNMVLDKSGLGIDTTRDWKQDALLVADGGAVTATPAYYVFRHISQYVTPGATVVGTTGGDAIAFKNPDGSLVAVMFNSGAANAAYVVAIGGKKLQFAMPGNGWATLKVKP
jgi:glucosylceramidase